MKEKLLANHEARAIRKSSESEQFGKSTEVVPVEKDIRVFVKTFGVERFLVDPDELESCKVMNRIRTSAVWSHDP